MQAIQTKYIGPSNVRGSRIKAKAAAGSITLHYDDSLNSDDNHRAAAMALAAKFGWDYGKWVGGVLPDASSVWVCDCSISSEYSFTVQTKAKAA